MRILHAISRLLSLAAITAAVASLPASCDVHEFPDDQNREEEVALRLVFNTNMSQWTMNAGNDTANASKPVLTASSLASGTMRYLVRLYNIADSSKLSGAKPVRKYEFERKVEAGSYDATLRLDALPGSYIVKVWADFLSGGKSFYDASAFDAIRLQGEHEGNNDLRDAFRGGCTLSVTPSVDDGKLHSGVVSMRRPMGKYEFVSTDLAEFFDRATKTFSKGSELSPKAKATVLERYRVKFVYGGFTPDVYNIFFDGNADSSTGVSFDGRLLRLSDNDVSLGFNYVFAGKEGTHVTVSLAIYDEAGREVAQSRPVRLPIKRDQHTIVYGRFLTKSAGGGLSIDPSFIGEYNYKVP